jgi:hypothetical protein
VVTEQLPVPSGALERPVFASLPQASGFRRKTTPFPYGRLLDIVREHPGQWALIAKFTKGPKKVTWNQVRYNQQKIKDWLERTHPLEEWKTATRTTADTWGDRELWVCFVGHYDSMEDAIATRKARRQEWEEGRGRGLVRAQDRRAREVMAAIQSARRRRA